MTPRRSPAGRATEILTAPGAERRALLIMKTETDLPQITRKQIGNTVYIIENTVSAGAGETAYDKVGRLILRATELSFKKAS